MWIKELPIENERKSFREDVAFLWKCDERPIYISDNHLTAAWCWLQECEPSEQYNFIHIDQHADLRGCGHPHLIDSIKNNPQISFKDFLNFEYNNGWINQFFQWDNFIRAIHHLFPNWFNSNFFYVHEDLDEQMDAQGNNWGYVSFPFHKRDVTKVREEITQFIENNNSFQDNTVNISKYPWIVSLDLDFFWDKDLDKIYDDEFIRDFSRRINSAMPNIKVLTIALSPDCVSGNDMNEKWSNVIEVLNIFKEEFNLDIEI